MKKTLQRYFLNVYFNKQKRSKSFINFRVLAKITHITTDKKTPVQVAL